MICPDCQRRMWGVQYRLTSEDYDGVSEWRCIEGCGLRIGRWTGKRLVGREIEGRYGREVTAAQTDGIAFPVET